MSYFELTGTKSRLVHARQPNPQTSQTVTCSILDQLTKNLSVPVVFFYREHLDAAALIDSLEVVLNDFPIFSGRFRETSHSLVLECNNAGVRFSQRVERGSLEQLLRDLPTIDKKRLVDELDPKRTIARQGPVLTVKLTRFNNGGTALGLCWHHALGDMHTLICFMKAWSAAASRAQYDLPLTIKDRAVYIQSHLSNNKNDTPSVRYLDDKSIWKLAWYIMFQARRKTVVNFYFSADELSRMKQTFSQKANRLLSSNDVLCAHLCSWIAHFDSEQLERYLAIIVNYRSRTQLSTSALGNFFETIQIPISKGAEPYQLAQTIRNTVDSFEAQHLSYFSICEYIEQNGGEKEISRFLHKGVDPINKTLFTTNWSNFGVYDVAFSGSKPFFFTSFMFIGEPFPWLSWMVEGCSNQGLIYSAVLPSKLMRKLTQTSSLRALHQYRDSDYTLPADLAQLPWLL